jgi:hypothetical protein
VTEKERRRGISFRGNRLRLPAESCEGAGREGDKNKVGERYAA